MTMINKKQEIERETANEIARQIGGQTFTILGATNKTYGTDKNGMVYIGFRIKGCRKINYIKVIYDEGLDMYHIEFGKIRKYEYKVVNVVTGIYFDQIHELIEENTGLYTHL